MGDGQFQSISTLLVLEYASACPSSSRLELDWNCSVRMLPSNVITL